MYARVCVEKATTLPLFLHHLKGSLLPTDLPRFSPLCLGWLGDGSRGSVC